MVRMLNKYFGLVVNTISAGDNIYTNNTDTNDVTSSKNSTLPMTSLEWNKLPPFIVQCKTNLLSTNLTTISTNKVNN